MVGRDPGHTRRVADGPEDPETVWVTALDGARATGTPAVVRGDLYVPVDAVTDRSRYRYRLHTLATATGEERWQVPLRSAPNGPPAVRGDRVVVTAQRAPERGRVVCFHGRYGDEDWLFDVDARLTAPPTIDGAVAYVPDWAGRVHALSLFDGSVRWSRRIGPADHSRTFAEPVAVGDGVLYAGSLSETPGVVALDADTGEERWHERTAPVTAGPVVHGGRVVVQTHQLVIAFDPDGTRRWSFNLLDPGVRTLAVDDQHVYATARERLFAIDRRGETAWTYEPADGRVGAPTVVGDSVVVRGRDSLVGLARDSGEERWTATPEGVGGAVVTPGAMFLAGHMGRVLALGD